jgi:S13-like H2TH domain
MALPEMTQEQRRQALAKAAEARRTRAELKELVRTGSLSFGEVIERAADDDIVAGTKVVSLLQALPGVGKVKAKRTMEELGIAENRKIRGLGSNQRAQLLERFS